MVIGEGSVGESRHSGVWIAMRRRAGLVVFMVVTDAWIEMRGL